MKEKIKKILFIIAEIITVTSAIIGMWDAIRPKIRISVGLESEGDTLCFILFFFLSAILILYLLRKYERKN